VSTNRSRPLCWSVNRKNTVHAQGILHRDIKPDNCLITDDDILKFVDFGVSEMFEKDSDMNTAKSAGSPAFMPPELCIAKHGEVSGKAADVWSMGVTLYCLRFGRIPFEKTGILELYEAIKGDELDIGQDCSEDFKDLMRGLLEKDPQKRIKIEQVRVSRRFGCLKTGFAKQSTGAPLGYTRGH
jgi:[calcium/calmodulin-dependent protein kinase] kinase